MFLKNRVLLRNRDARFRSLPGLWGVSVGVLLAAKQTIRSFTIS